MPPTATHLSKHNLKYGHRLARRKKLDDMTMTAMVFDVPTVEELMKSPLAKFITSENDCGYGGNTKDLVVNWFHQLLLKPKTTASKEDNPTWWEAMCGPFADEYWEAAVTEIDTQEAMDAWGVAGLTEERNALKSF